MLRSISLIGTTSCGKSTIGNFLSGHFILPTGVQETTTSSIELCHDPFAIIPMLTFLDKKGNAIEEKPLATDIEIRESLKEAMLTAHAGRTHIRLQFSMNVARRDWLRKLTYYLHQSFTDTLPMCAEFQIPQGFTIRDFPGFQHEQDTARLHLIKQQLDTTDIILFIFNAEETDSRKEDKLLQNLFTILRQTGHDWQNIIFVINRKDAFLRDKNPQEALNQALSERTDRIRKLITTTWGKTDNVTVNIVPISAGFIFTTELLWWHDRYLLDADRAYLHGQIVNWSNALLPEATVEKLPRSAKKWRYHQWLSVYKEMHSGSGLSELIHTLKDKIAFLELRNSPLQVTRQELVTVLNSKTTEEYHQ